MRKKRNKNFAELGFLIDYLHNVDAIHVKRGFKLSEATALDASNHMLEEAVELQAEVIAGDGSPESVVEEAADTLICYLHLLKRMGVKVDDVTDRAYNKLLEVFTCDPKKVTAVKPGKTRKGRAPSPKKSVPCSR